tara:strand:+ start:521 stop:745 length:225 start_codon:yes stop_codon:yes gene_type:complete
MGKSKDNIYDLELFESLELEEDINFDALKVMRVPGGWLIENMSKVYHYDKEFNEDHIIRHTSEPVFVPYHEEFI